MSEPALILTASDFAPLRDDLSAMDGAIAAVERATVAHYRGESQPGAFNDGGGHESSLRISIAVASDAAAGMRVFGNPPNSRFYVLLDGESLRLLSLMDYGVLNSMRVGAVGGLAARALAPAGAHVVGLLGSGWQAPTQVQALRRALPNLDLIKVYSPTREHRESFAQRMTEWADVRVEAVGSAEEAIRDADVLDLVAPGHADARSPLFDPAWVKPGALAIVTAGNQCEADFVRDSRVVAATREGVLSEGSIRPPYTQLFREGAITTEDIIQLGAVLQDGLDPRQSPTETVIYELENTYVHDLFIADWGYHWARDRGLGTPFDLSA
jgi:alanine dehydrogenase